MTKLSNFLFAVSLGLSFALSCKSQQGGNSTEKKVVVEQSSAMSTGVVSHMFRKTGCETVIIIKTPTDSLILIPKEKLNEFDVDGLKIRFNYRTLKMPNPKGCLRGMPAEIRNIKRGL